MTVGVAAVVEIVHLPAIACVDPADKVAQSIWRNGGTDAGKFETQRTRFSLEFFGESVFGNRHR